jgi:predicted transposase YbfD/YdcC
MRYFISSLDPDVVSAAQFQEYILRHWEVENCLHLAKDCEWDEDKHRFSRPGLGKVWTVLTNIAVSLVRLLRKDEKTLREVREKCLHDPRPTARKLGWKN